MRHFRLIRQLDRGGRATLIAALLAEVLLLTAGASLLSRETDVLPFLLLAAESGAFALLDALLLHWLGCRKRRPLEEASRAELKAFLLKQRVLRHDFNIHLMALSGLLEAGRYQESERYLQEMLDSSREVSQLMPLDDPAVSAMLSQMASDAKKRDIRLECLIYYDCAGVGCDAYEMNMILGNLIRNACEAVEALPSERRQVTVTILHRRNNCILRVDNPLPEGADLDERIFQAGYSGKKGHAGIGLAAVGRLVRSLGGTIFMEQEDGAVSMIVQLPLKN